MAMAEPVAAFEQGSHGDAEVTEEGVREMIESELANGVPGGGSSNSSDGCDWSVEPYPFNGVEPPASVGPPPSPEHELYIVYCNGEYRGVEWLGPGQAVDTIADTLIARFIKDLPIGISTIGARPEGRGVTGIASYFWVEGYQGQPINDSLSAGGVTVAVSVTLGTVTWDFGDGTPPLTAGLGEAWPERSSVSHNYRDRGDRTVTVTIVLPAEYSVNGGAVQQLSPVVRTATIPYVVEEIQAVRNR